jgi:hypothetical protein
MWKQRGWPAMHRGIEDLGDGIAAQRVVYEQLLRDRGDRVLRVRDERKYSVNLWDLDSHSLAELRKRPTAPRDDRIFTASH